MLIQLLEPEFVICKVSDFSELDLDQHYFFLAKTDEECSIVCAAERIPASVIEVERSWRAFRIEGQLDFSLIGVISKLSSFLAEQQISVFVVSTFNTDYFLVKSHQLEMTMETLKSNGYQLI